MSPGIHPFSPKQNGACYGAGIPKHGSMVPYREKLLSFVFWWFNARETPVLIPNTEVKPCSGDGTRKGRVANRQYTVLNIINFSLVPGLSSVVPMILARGK